MAQRLMIAACAVTLFGTVSGVGLGRFATGGSVVEMIERDTGETLLGRPEALIADRAGTDYAGTPAIIPTVCEGCGPGLQERQAMARDREIAAQIARQDAMFAEGRIDDWRLETDIPAYRVIDDRGDVAPSLPTIVKLEGASATMAETSDPSS